MKKESTTIRSWNYTLPNLSDYFDSLLSAQASTNKSDLEIVGNLNSSFFLFGNDTVDAPYFGHSTDVTDTPNKPFFTFNLNHRSSSTMTAFVGEAGERDRFSSLINISDYHLNGHSSLSFSMSAPRSTNLFLLDTNDSFVSVDDTWWLPNNATLNGSARANATVATEEGEALRQMVTMIVTSTILGIMILTTIIGNVFVIAAILLERNLQQVANFLIVSLAVADLMVACLVMPLGAVYEISKEWVLGPELCDMWTSCDVLCCTASILHLVAIALDRYWAVTHVAYIQSRNARRIGTMILFVWMTAFVVSIAPLFGWKDADYHYRVNEQKRCLVSQDIAYQIFATMATFYVPLTAILILYWKIFQTARKRIHKRTGKNERATQMLKKIKATNRARSSSKLYKTNGLPQEPQQTTAFTTCSSGHVCAEGGGEEGEAAANDSPSENAPFPTNGAPLTASTEACLPCSSACDVPCDAPTPPPPPPPPPKKTNKKESLQAKREKKAAKTLAIITGAFVVCWLPFFVNILVMSICPTCWANDIMFSFFLWLGYFNSTLNPIIYTIFSPEFRQAFKRILCGAKPRRYRPGKSH